ncbi:MAG: ribonuclease Y [Chlamydiales bacterium]
MDSFSLSIVVSATRLFLLVSPTENLLMNPEQILNLTIPGLIGALIGAISFWIYHLVQVGNYQNLAGQIIHKAELESEALKTAKGLALKEYEIEQRREVENMWNIERKKSRLKIEQLKNKEEQINSRNQESEKKFKELKKLEATLISRKTRYDDKEKALEKQGELLRDKLEKSSGLNAFDAKEQLLKSVETQLKADSANLVRKIRVETQRESEREAAQIISTAINRLAVSCVSEATVSTVPLPNEEMKGRIIGKEGRNIRTLEMATGINIIIDDTPCAVVISGFDPIRKEIARLALTELVADGRIHPTRIEETVEKAKRDILKQIKESGEEAAASAGIMNLHPSIINLLGRLNYRYSYGQNILKHSLEVSLIMGILAAELGLDIKLAKRIGLLHDMGKALSHEVEGTHAVIGHDFALKYGESHDVANGIGCHHFEMDACTIEGSLCNIADSISASRPGARIEAVEEYITRLDKLEKLAMKFTGVERAYAMQAGREIRVMVRPDEIDDDETVILSRNMAKRIEKELNFPGKIKVTIIRERRAVEYAV